MTSITSTSSTAAVVFREGLGVAAWEKRNAASPVPGLWPYGLDRLSKGFATVDPVEVPEVPRWRRGLPGWARRALRQRIGGRFDADVALCWDEQTVAAMLDGVHARQFFSGVIWATDRVAAGAGGRALVETADALRSANGLWVLSRAQIVPVRDWLGRDCPPVDFLRFGIDHDFYAPTPYPDRPHIVSAGGDRDRDPETLFAALAAVHASRPEVPITVQTSSALTPPEGVTVVKRLPHAEMARLLASATVVAIPTMPNLHASAMTVGLEAMSSGRPVIVCDTPGMRDDYFSDGEDSLLIPPCDVDALTERILHLLASPDAAASMGARGAETVAQRHTSEQMCAQLASLMLKDART